MFDPIIMDIEPFDIYNNDSMYKEWFDRKYPGQSIYEIIGIPELEMGPNRCSVK